MRSDWVWSRFEIPAAEISILSNVKKQNESAVSEPRDSLIAVLASGGVCSEAPEMQSGIFLIAKSLLARLTHPAFV